jgi:hypothetical protein
MSSERAKVKSSVLRFFKFCDDSADKWKCVCGKLLTQKKGTGWTNLVNHLKAQHPDWQMEQNQAKMENFLDVVSKPTTSAENVHSWLEWICLGMKPFSFLTDPLTRKYSNLNSISINTFKKYMDSVVHHVEEEISAFLPDKFALILDGWTSKCTTHYLAVFASFESNNSLGFSTVLLAFSPLLVETEFTASAHKDFLDWMLENVYNKSMSNVVAIIADNAEVNKALSKQCGKPFVGCASHRFNLAVVKLMDPYKEILNKLNGLMGKLKTLKLSGELRKHSHLHPVQRNVTRWSSTASMVHRYFELKPHLVHFDNHSELIDYMPTARESSDLMELEKVLQQLASVTKALQRESLDLADVRMLFDEVMSVHTDTQPYIGRDGNIVMCKHFENAVVKILHCQEHTLSTAEADAVACLNLDVIVEPDSELDFASAVLKRRKIQSVSLYMDCRFILPTSNVCERFFSTAGYCLNDYRQNILPLNLEKQLFLKVNKAFWDARAVSKVITKTNIQ